MMNYIEQMMQTAGIKPEPIYSEVWADEQVGVSYPDFTAEKQLELIKLIAQESVLKILALPISKNWAIMEHSGKYGNNIDFTQALAQLTTELMEAGELDKEKVKDILKDD